MKKSKKILLIIYFIYIILYLSSNVLAAKARAFGISSKPYSYGCSNLADLGFKKLNYSSQSINGNGDVSSIMSWINLSEDNYAFYINTQGNTDVFYDNYWNPIYSNNISGNWDFVFLDSSNSAINVNFANSFKINGYSNRAFLGWSGNVTDYNSYLFATHFWNSYVGNMPIRTAALHAAANVPGSGTTPIKFYGDISYYGTSR